MHQYRATDLLNPYMGFKAESHSPAGCKNARIAIIGCGASGVALLTSLISFIKNSKYQNYTICIFEKGCTFGPGLAYQCDSEDLLMNMVSSTTSINTNKETDFWEWVLDRGHRIGNDQIMSKLGVAPDSYISRQFFGLYLRDCLDEAITEAKKINISVSLINYEVNDIEEKDNRFNVHYSSSEIGQYDYVVLCIGNTDPSDTYQLSGLSQYINNPYPVFRYSKAIRKDNCIGIIGGQLTAADIAIVLAKQGHLGPIYFFTNRNYYPLVRCQKQDFELINFNIENLEKIKSINYGEITLRQALRLARKDFSRAGIRWNKIFKSIKNSYASWIEWQILNRDKYSLWQSFAIASDSVIANYWDALSRSSKLMFMSQYHRLWMSRRVPLPVHTSLKLHSLFKSGILIHRPNLINIEVNVDGKFIASALGESKADAHIKVACDWVINAMGPSRSIENKGASPLIQNLLKRGLIHPNLFGGIEVDFHSSLVKKGAQNVEGLYAIGQLTLGAYYYVSSLDMVALRAKNVACHLVRSWDSASSNGVKSSEYESAI